tara:strand:- start:464 stop:1246 length:783 start_codon:yes stop_codon:yes gene_type:complete
MDRLILSTDDNETYINFFPIVAKAWKKFFDIEVSLAYVTDKDDNHPLVTEMRKYGEVHLFPVVRGVPTGNQAKMARFFLAGMYGDDVCMVNDIDTAPLSTPYFERVLSQYQPGKLLAVGAEVYNNTPHAGKFPIGEITATGKLFEQIVNPEGHEFFTYINSFKFVNVHDHKENILGHEFSDESLLRVLIERAGIEVVHAKRDVDINTEWIDRSWWNIDIDKLHSEGYTLVNFLRPLMPHFEDIKPIIDYIYGETEFKDIF